MTRLAELEQQFFDAVVRGGSADGLLVDPARAQIYADMYRLRLVDCLRVDFPQLVAHLGDDTFTRLAEQYLAAAPSRHPSARYFGRDFPAALCALTEAPWATELAALEWARVDVFDDPDEDVVDGAMLAALGPELAEAPLQRIAALRLVPTRFAVEDLWQPAADHPTQPPGERTGTLVVWRELPNRIYHRRLDAGEARWLERLAAPVSLAQLCSAPPDSDAEPTLLLSRLQRLVTDGVLRLPDRR